VGLVEKQEAHPGGNQDTCPTEYLKQKKYNNHPKFKNIPTPTNKVQQKELHFHHHRQKKQKEND